MRLTETEKLQSKQLLTYLRRRYSPYLYFSEYDPSSSRAVLGIEIQEFVLDHKDKNDSEIRFIELDDIASIKWSRNKKDFRITDMNRNEFVRRVNDRYMTMTEHSQQALLPTLYTRLVRIPQVDMNMSPLRNILTAIEEDGFVLPNALGKKYEMFEQVRNYFTLLRDLHYIKEERGQFVAGPEMKNLQANEIEPPLLYETILGEVLRKQAGYLQDVLHWTMITPYLRWCNAYYYPAFMAGHLVKAEQNELVQNYKRFYGGGYQESVVETGQIQRIVHVEILSKEGRYYEGHQTIFEEFSGNAKQDAVLLPAMQN
ncbi:MAG: hypothetical protein JRN17_04200 [Nitrososphaerota archaeon]|nr:hypothetical protein [Nitrososphaerota archaeon]MDG7012852.1 hypothetical protein [Nitrososphaerota archaeon]